MLRMGPSRLRSHGWLRCPKPLSLSGFDDCSAVILCSLSGFEFGIVAIGFSLYVVVDVAPAEPGLGGSTHLRCYPSHAAHGSLPFTKPRVATLPQALVSLRL